MNACKTLFLALLLIISSIGVLQAKPQKMTTDHIRSVLSEMLVQHIERHQLDGDRLHSALIHYIKAADPKRIYLLENEVQRFFTFPSSQLQKMQMQYNENDFSFFREANALLQQGIKRARQFRKYTDNEYRALFRQAYERHGKSGSEYEGSLGYAKSEEELRDRQKRDFLSYIDAMMTRFDAQNVLENQKLVINRYRRQLRYHESAYLFEDPEGRSLSKPLQEHFFATNIVKAIATTLDAHSSFFNDAEAFDIKLRLEKGFVGIGVILTEVLEGYKISQILPGSPAAKSDLQVDDRVIEVNGQILAGLSFDEVMKLVRGQVERPVEIVLEKASLAAERPKRKTVTLIPALIVLQEGRVKTSYEPFLDGIIGYITLESFYEGPEGVSSVQDMIDAIRQLSNEGKIYGLILDLRNNSGGYLTQAVKVAGLFITNGVVVMSKYSDGQKHYYRDLDGKAYYNGPLIVLTSKFTASAAEIVAQALQDYGVALIVGDMQTYGKGTIQAQTITEGDNTQYFKVTVGKYYTVSGMTPQMRGVKADVYLPGPYSAMKIGEEYLEMPLASDMIQPAFQDELADVKPNARLWYAKYYLPTLQTRQTGWQAMLPLLRERSEARVELNKAYQLYLKNNGMDSRWKFAWSEADVDLTHFKVEEFQIYEATNILKDMVKMEEPMAARTVISE